MSHLDSGWKDWRYWRNILVSAFFVAVTVVSIIILVSVAGRDYWDTPPVNVQRISPEDLGTLCPGQSLPIQNIIIIKDPTIAVYYISTMDAKGIINILGQQQIYSGLQHPTPGTFEQELPWYTPDLPPDIYTRAYAARGIDTSETSVFVTSTFTIGDDC